MICFPPRNCFFGQTWRISRIPAKSHEQMRHRYWLSDPLTEIASSPQTPCFPLPFTVSSIPRLATFDNSDIFDIKSNIRHSETYFIFCLDIRI
jgi:hypothetical protein